MIIGRCLIFQCSLGALCDMKDLCGRLADQHDWQISDDGQDDRVAFGVSAMQGWRISMEDAHAAVLDLQAEDADKDFVAASVDDRLSFFGVYDGHGGDKVALFAGENIHKILAKQESFKKKDFEQALKDGFLATDRAILNGELDCSGLHGNI